MAILSGRIRRGRSSDTGVLAPASGFAERGDRFAGRWCQRISAIACSSSRDSVGCYSAQGHKPTVVADSDTGLAAAALVCGNIEDVRAWVAGVLGGLATDTDSDARLRETFRVFLNNGASYTLAAEQLSLHFNTVKYRLGRARAGRGRPITDDCFDVELAF